MNLTFRRAFAITMIAVLTSIFAASCAKPEETKPKSGSYYEGPMKPKDTSGAGS